MWMREALGPRDSFGHFDPVYSGQDFPAVVVFPELQHDPSSMAYDLFRHGIEEKTHKKLKERLREIVSRQGLYKGIDRIEKEHTPLLTGWKDHFQLTT